MDIFVEKFGGASVNSADAVRNVEKILLSETKNRIVVISAMGKTTNKLENIVNTWFNEHRFHAEQYRELTEYHQNIINSLFSSGKTAIDCLKAVENLFKSMEQRVTNYTGKDYNYLYDNIVSTGEKVSTTIVSAYLNYRGLSNCLIDAGKVIITDNNFRDANIDWQSTQARVIKLKDMFSPSCSLLITQGFIGGTLSGDTTTLGREGSDFSAAILAHCLNAKTMTVWKDVPGLMNADPKRVPDTVHILSVPYTEAVELSYYGAGIIHPKTIKPLENVSVPLYIKSFVDPTAQGTVICSSGSVCPIVPNYIFKDNQILMSVSPKDLSFATESSISKIFSVLAKHKVKVNLMQNSAISFSVCFDENKSILPLLTDDLSKDFNVLYNTNLQLITIRHYTLNAIEETIRGRRILIEQKSRTTAQYLVSNSEPKD
ncbi:MAG: aspartate kinase [Bacteroidales bacterium]|nr:aspartate kinase [Bacteroidales bacterium]